MKIIIKDNDLVRRRTISTFKADRDFIPLVGDKISITDENNERIVGLVVSREWQHFHEKLGRMWTNILIVNIEVIYRGI